MAICIPRWILAIVEEKESPKDNNETKCCEDSLVADNEVSFGGFQRKHLMRFSHLFACGTRESHLHMILQKIDVTKSSKRINYFPLVRIKVEEEIKLKMQVN